MAETVPPYDVFQKLAGEIRNAPPLDWHEAAVQYLEMDAAIRDLVKDETHAQTGRKVANALSRYEQLLRFDQSRPDGQMSRYHSPVKFDPQDFHKQVLEAFRSALSR